MLTMDWKDSYYKKITTDTVKNMESKEVHQYFTTVIEALDTVEKLEPIAYIELKKANPAVNFELNLDMIYYNMEQLVIQEVANLAQYKDQQLIEEEKQPLALLVNEAVHMLNKKAGLDREESRKVKQYFQNMIYR
ncbi:hypothetical protein [Risungbinella massiliensis]|uniref:hypothetical protein n=1 Tax=Risungbinella massiliensis TaxID=1329796 RepID=UPI0005CC3294|nr:hypothetical protein [Risungbinella massiliensis]